jgi:hypothetical protein
MLFAYVTANKRDALAIHFNLRLVSGEHLHHYVRCISIFFSRSILFDFYSLFSLSLFLFLFLSPFISLSLSLSLSLSPYFSI